MTSSLPGQPIDIPLPPDTALTFGYGGDARFVGFYYTPLGDELVYTDGVNSGSGQTWAYLGYKRHRAVAPLLAPFDFGSSEEDGQDMLLIDRERNLASVAPVAEARAFLIEQHPPAPEMTPEEQAAFEREFTRLLHEMQNRPIDHDAIAKRMAEQRARVGRFMNWLDMCPSAEGQAR